MKKKIIINNGSSLVKLCALAPDWYAELSAPPFPPTALLLHLIELMDGVCLALGPAVDRVPLAL